MSGPADPRQPHSETAANEARVAIRSEIERADHCHGIVTRDGEMDACGKPPVALIDATAYEDGCFWPACAYHANRYGGGRCVPLATIRSALS